MDAQGICHPADRYLRPCLDGDSRLGPCPALPYDIVAGKPNAYWVVSGNHPAGSAAFRELPARLREILAAAAAFKQLRPSRTVVIGSDIHLVRSLREIGWANHAHRPVLEHVGIDHGGIEIGVPQEFLNGSDILPTL